MLGNQYNQNGIYHKLVSKLGYKCKMYSIYVDKTIRLMQVEQILR